MVVEDYALALGGFVLLFLGGESLLRGAVGLAQRFGVSTLFIGVVVVGFGTSAPEFLVCLEAALRGQDDLTVGNIVGSNIANVMLIVGVAAAIRPVMSRPAVLRRDGFAMLGASALLVGLALHGGVERWIAVGMLLLLAGFLTYCAQCERRGDDCTSYTEEVEDITAAPRAIWLGVLTALLGIGLLVSGSNMLIAGATGIAQTYGVSEAVIGVTLVALGTSLPELATVFVAALRHHGDVALGNVLGSNVFNVLGMLGLTSLIEPVAISPAFLSLDMWVMLGVSALLLVFMRTGQRVTRTESGVLLAGYALYVAFLLNPAGMAAG
jgi:cation:H+ antiporter